MADRVEQLLKAGNEASACVRNLWITFLLFGTYLAIAIGGTTHRQMLLEEPLVLPILDTGLPLVDFYRIAPGLFLVFHFYMLVQLYLLAQKLHRLESHIENDLKPGDDRRHIRDQADNFLITQLLVGRQRIWLVRAFIWLAAWLTMVLAPVVLLLAFQIRFLPYHDVLTTWIHRIFIIADLGLIWLLWPAVTSRDGGLGGAVVEVLWKPWVRLYEAIRYTVRTAAERHKEIRLSAYVDLVVDGFTIYRRFWRTITANLFWAAVTVLASLAVIGFSVLVATIPAEEMERWLLDHPLVLKDRDGKPLIGPDGKEQFEDWWLCSPQFRKLEVAEGDALPPLFSFHTWTSQRPRERPVPVESEPNAVWWPTAILFEGEPDQASSKVTSLFSRNLVLIDDIDLVTLSDGELAKTDRTLVLRGRDLRHARFDRSDLRKADMFGAKLAGAVMAEARLDGANLQEAKMQGANLETAILNGANIKRAKLEYSNLERAIVISVDLSQSDLTGANMNKINLEKSNLSEAILRSVNLDKAIMEESNLHMAELHNSSFIEANLNFANLSDSFPSSARFFKADLRKVNFKNAVLLGANFEKANLKGANLEEVDAKGVTFYDANFQGAMLGGAKLQGADLSLARLQGADLQYAHLHGASLWEAYLGGADLRHASLQAADLTGVKLQGASLGDASLIGAELWTARLDGANVTWAKLQGADLQFANLQGANLSWVEVWRTTFTEADLTLADASAVSHRPPKGATCSEANATKVQTMVDDWLTQIPEGDRKEIARKRLDRLTDIAGQGECDQSIWHDAAAQPTVYWNRATEAKLADLLGDLGCAAENAPYIARGLLTRIADVPLSERSRPYHPLLAAALLAPECAGAKGLTEDERARLQAIANTKPE